MSIIDRDQLNTALTTNIRTLRKPRHGTPAYAKYQHKVQQLEDLRRTYAA